MIKFRDNNDTNSNWKWSNNEEIKIYNPNPQIKSMKRKKNCRDEIVK
jgi:hypothetical protein